MLMDDGAAKLELVHSLKKVAIRPFSRTFSLSS